MEVILSPVLETTKMTMEPSCRRTGIFSVLLIVFASRRYFDVSLVHFLFSIDQDCNRDVCFCECRLDRDLHSPDSCLIVC